MDIIEDGKETTHSPELRRIQRPIASVVVISADGKFLLGRKHPEKNGSYADKWHIVGGGLDPGEDLKDAAIRESKEEAGLVLDRDQLTPISPVGEGESTRVEPSGETVIAEMTFNRFEARLDKTATEVGLPSQTDEFAELRWFTPEELQHIDQIPGGKEFFVKMGYIAESS